ncbi:uncharacterized protein LOC134531816 isoform X2 [Bacillus rossius redtenbacheri]|uniref:uncharacterized protein LOC134531816 isoform X2 n=1 Tax=Bacillus rossius redtenbacheri TaxID=93214 RepID=UPI002FDCC0C4
MTRPPAVRSASSRANYRQCPRPSPGTRETRTRPQEARSDDEAPAGAPGGDGAAAAGRGGRRRHLHAVLPRPPAVQPVLRVQRLRVRAQVPLEAATLRAKGLQENAAKWRIHYYLHLEAWAVL